MLPTADSASGATTTIRNYCLVLLQLALLAALVFRFEIEQQRHFFPVLCYVIAGFAAHFWVPTRYRLSGFAVLSMGCALFVLGVVNGLCVVAGVSICIGVCFLPIPAFFRNMILLSAVAVLVCLRAWTPSPIWPILGSILMFRLILFVHECTTKRTLPDLAVTASYFFMLPNACFPFFPVIDFRTFQSSYDSTREWEIHQQGIRWILRGIAHLLLYRAVRLYLLPDINELRNIGQIAGFLMANYALYLQVSGQFHLITGILHLFGFDLPRTHNQYFLASSFSDIWRRINIYWKDFMSKCFFFPAFFSLRRLGFTAGRAITLSVLWVFFGTWLLHSWQTWWLLGRFPVTLNDAILWLGAGVCVSVNAALEARRRTSLAVPTSLWSSFRTAAQTVAMLILVSLFWGCWTRPDFLQLSVAVLSLPDGWNGFGTTLTILIIAVIIGTGIVHIQKTRRVRTHSRIAESSPNQSDFRESAAVCLATMTLLLAIPSAIITTFPRSEFAKSIASLQSAPSVSQDAILRGYYEDLNSAAVQAGPLLESFSDNSELERKQALGFEKVSRSADLYQGLELIPGMVTELNGSRTSINQFGMRDRASITLSKPPDTTRIAVIGSSIVMGYGVNDDETFCRVLEMRINSDATTEASRRVEVLNFGVGKQYAPHRLVRFQRQVLKFSPNVLIYMAHQDELSELAGHTGSLIAAGLPLPSSHLQDVADRAAVSSSMPPGEIHSRLLAIQPELLKAVYLTVTDECSRRGIKPVWIYLPIPDPNSGQAGRQIIPIAEAAGFQVFDATDWHRNQDRLFPSSQDYHPTAKGQRLIAESLYDIVMRTS
ncbi:MAG: SGNH/GDSL hydrolase family protein, partial [Planctomyces sp.]